MPTQCSEHSFLPSLPYENHMVCDQKFTPTIVMVKPRWVRRHGRGLTAIREPPVDFGCRRRDSPRDFPSFEQQSQTSASGALGRRILRLRL
jgi:hypothetical protein